MVTEGVTTGQSDKPASGATRVLLVTNVLEAEPTGGRQLLCRLNHDILKDIYQDRLVVQEIPKRPVRGLRGRFQALKGNIDGVSPATVAAIVKQVQSMKVGKVFADGSNLGRLVKSIKRKAPGVQVYTFFHNVEVRFFWGSLKQVRTPHALGVLIANYRAERAAVRSSDRLLCLNQRDSRILERIYGRPATDIMPLSLRDRPTPHADVAPASPPGAYILFVGGAFYANRAGIEWYAKNVAPHVDVDTYLVGRGLEGLRKDLEAHASVKVVGEVDELGPWYRGARFVVAPIFDGSGMKTKVAEAMMHGKKVVGTPEAFMGYEAVEEDAGWTCRTAEEFIKAIQAALTQEIPPFDAGIRDLYGQTYSYDAARSRMKAVMEKG